MDPAKKARAAKIVEYWLPKYGGFRPWVDEDARGALVRSEDRWLAGFRGLQSLTQAQVNDLIDWKWQGYPAKRIKSRRDVASDWSHASQRILTALAATDPATAIDALRHPTGGIPTWQTSTASVVLMACQPDQYTVADSRALKTARLIECDPADSISAIAYFPPTQWRPYLGLCRDVGTALEIRLRDVDRAFWACNGRKPPGGLLPCHTEPG